jgi:acyl-homoserine-lactone acylase
MRKFYVKQLVLILAVASAALGFQGANESDATRWKQEAARATIIRDDWGIAHVYGKTDADAVFGMEYAQAEDDFNRVETNYINAMGRLAEAEGESKVYQDLRMKLFIDPKRSEEGLRRQPGVAAKAHECVCRRAEFYLAQHPEVKPRVIQRFEPWMALSFTEGSIGGDIEKVNLGPLAGALRQAFRSPQPRAGEFDPEPGARTARRLRPNTVNHRALLLINPHTSFYFRSELQMVSDEGLDAYGAVTWGQFFMLSGLQRACRLDAHIERRGCRRRVPGNRHQEGRPSTLSSTETKSAR